MFSYSNESIKAYNAKVASSSSEYETVYGREQIVTWSHLGVKKISNIIGVKLIPQSNE